MSNILVTGGLGAIGAPLVTELRKRGHRVVSLDLRHQPDQYAPSIRNDESDIANDGSLSYYVRCNVADYRQLQRVFNDDKPFDYVYHCAAEFGRWNGEDYYEQLWRTNAIGTKNILTLQRDVGFSLIFFSSSEIYGDWRGVMEEDVPDKHPIHLLNDYAMTKWVGEMQVHNSIGPDGIHDSVIVRLFNTYGPGEHYSPYRSVNCRFLYSALTGRPWVVHQGHQRTSTYVSDTIHTLANITDNFIPGEVYNIAGDELHTIEELSEVVLDVTLADPELVTLADPEPMTTRVKEASVEKAKRDLDHKCTVGLHEGMQRTAQWMREVYGL